MRIAVSGTHCTGKSTLVEDLALRLPHYLSFAEPYHLLQDDGYEFNHPPSVEDFVAQLERSLELLHEPGPDILFDRSPLDLLAYLQAHPDAGAFNLDDWIPRVQQAMSTVNLVVFVPIETPDRVIVRPSENSDGSRDAVDDLLRDLVVADSLQLGVCTLEVSGPPELRTDSVLGCLHD